MKADDPVVFPRSRTPGIRVPHMVLIATGFFVIVQIGFLEDTAGRVIFALFFAVFMLIGLVLSAHSVRTWPQDISMSRHGISYSSMQAMHGIDMVPWLEVERIDLFYQHRLPPFLRIGLRDGAFKRRLRKLPLQRLSFGLDVNVPVEVEADAEVVLETARRFFEAGRRG